MISCSDGFRPASFLLEALNIGAERPLPAGEGSAFWVRFIGHLKGYYMGW